LSGIPTHDPNVRARSEDSPCQRPRGHYDRLQTKKQCVTFKKVTHVFL
jgi:hypothetical protein